MQHISWSQSPSNHYSIFGLNNSNIRLQATSFSTQHICTKVNPNIFIDFLFIFFSFFDLLYANVLSKILTIFGDFICIFFYLKTVPLLDMALSQLLIFPHIVQS